VKNYKIIVEYDGTDFVGWQRQKNGLAIQQALEEAVQKVTGEKVHVQGAGRTDSGVHAVGQVANFRTGSRIPPQRLLHAINAHLPDEIVVKSIRRVGPDFHAQFNARSKVYRYTILNSKIRSPLARRYCWQVKQELDIRKMRAAVRCLEGRHDFSAFETESWRKSNSIRRVKRVEIRRRGEYIYVTIEATGFLYNMVRAIVGTAVDVGRGRLSVADMKRILESRDRKQAGPTAPARGLCLVEVKYR